MECPKCRKRLKATDWRQICPHCGANVVLYDLQERLMLEADKAEVQYYHFQKKIDAIKTAFVGSKLSVVRIFTSLIPAAAIFLPLIKVEFREPLKPFAGDFGALQLYDTMGDADLKAFAGLLARPETKTAAVLFLISAVSVILSVVVILARFICLTAACSPRGKIRNYTFGIVLILLVVLSSASIAFMPENPVINATLGIGSLVYLILAVLNLAVDVLVFREKVEVKHTPCFVGGIPAEEYFKMVDDGVSREELRAEMYRRLSAAQEEKDRAALKKKEELEKEELKKKEAEAIV